MKRSIGRETDIGEVIGVEFRVLWPVGVTNGSDDVSIGGGRQRRLLAALLVDEGRVVSVDRLVDVVWGDEALPPDGAGRTVLSYVSRLRSALGEGRIRTEEAGYRLVRDDVTLDASRFSALVADAHTVPPSRALGLLDEALGLWRGRAFGELADEAWARPSAVRLEELRLVALEERAQARLDLGAHAEAVAELEELVDAHPLRERFRLQLMVALYRSGRQAEALRVFHDYRNYLADETGLEPSRDLVELERRIALADHRSRQPSRRQPLHHRRRPADAARRRGVTGRDDAAATCRRGRLRDDSLVG